MIIKANKAPFFTKLQLEWLNLYFTGSIPSFDQFLKSQYGLTITTREWSSTWGWSQSNFIFESEQDYFLALLQLS